jgi:capsular exopolysaccharide synthesis family protein
MLVNRELVFTRVAPPPFAAPATRAGGRRDKLVMARSMPAAAVEQYRKLAAALHHSQVQHGTKVVMMASTLAGEGKTLTATNLALTLSESYRRRVALIDADLRRPTVHDMFGLPNVSGLNDVLNAGGGTSCEIFDVSPCLSVLTAGRPNPDPIGGLTSDRMRQLVAAAAQEFEWVILDTPPVGLLPDANLLGSMVDTVVLVVAAGRTQHRMIHRTIEALGRERIFGVVLNRAATDPLWGGYGSYYYQAYGSDL